MRTIFQRHCSDESLISHLDGELPFYRRASVRRHLEKCWQCRLRFSELADQVLEATRAMKEDSFPGADRIAAARIRFLASANRMAAEVLSKERPARSAGLPRLVWAAGCLVLLLAYPLWHAARRGPAPEAAAIETIRRVETVEAEAARRAAHQQFRVVVRQLQPQVSERESRLEVWSEPQRGRFASRLSDRRGVLRHAVWQPEPGRQYVYRAGRSEAAETLTRREAREQWDNWLYRRGLTLEEFEEGLLSWLESRPWRPVSFTSGVAVLAGMDGAVLVLEEVRATRRLRVRKTIDRVTLEFTLEIDSRTHVPSLQAIRYESAGRRLELVLYAEHAASAEPVSFEPPASLLARRTAPTIPAPLMPTSASRPSTDDSGLELRLYLTLHRLGACLSESVEVHRRPDGALEVRGALASPERKGQLTAALAPLAGPRLVLNLKSSKELLEEMQPESVTLDRQPAPRLPDRAGALKFLSRLFPDQAAAEAFADQTLSAGEAVMREAQALRLLAETFGGRSDLDSPQARRMLEGMISDHLKHLEARVEAARRHLQPILGSIEHAPAPTADAAGRWDLELLRISKDAEALNNRLRRLFAGTGENHEPELLLAEIKDLIPMFESNVRAAAGRALTTRLR